MFFVSKYLLVCIVHFIGITLIIKILPFIIPLFINSFFSSLLNLIICLFFARFTFEFTKRILLTEKISPRGKAVLITGCSSGFGFEIAKRLDSRGFHVFASCRSPSCQGAQELKEICSKRLQIIQLDVTKDESVNEALQTVTNSLGNLELWAIVNNAGVQIGYVTEFSTLQDFKDNMEANCFGMIRVTKAFSPLLLQSKGRIVNVTSTIGRSACHLMGAYCTSKFAAAGFSDCLRQEMNPWGIRVIQIEPEIFKTRMADINEVENRIDSSLANVDPKRREEYGETYFANFKILARHLLVNFSSSNIDRVTDNLESAVSSKYPDSVYKTFRNYFFTIGGILYEMFPLKIPDLVFELIFRLASFVKLPGA